MKKNKFTESQIVKAIKEAENGLSILENMRLPYLILSSWLLLPSCHSTEADELKAKLQQRQETKARIEKENQNAVLALVEQNDAWMGWDTTNLIYANRIAPPDA